MAVKLAEELIGKSIASADGNTFIDTSDTYVLKVYAAGIMSGVSTTEFDQNGTLTRQQMGAFLYRTLRYVKQNSELKYTSYNSKLDSYTDSWAVIGRRLKSNNENVKTVADILQPSFIYGEHM